MERLSFGKKKSTKGKGLTQQFFYDNELTKLTFKIPTRLEFSFDMHMNGEDRKVSI